MAPEHSELDRLIDRYKDLRNADQAAVFAQLSTDERERVLSAMTRRELARQAELAAASQAGRRYSAYSPWLAKLARSADDGAAESITPAAAKALVEAHRALASEEQRETYGLIGQLRAWFERVLDPGVGASR